jgi:hypothetical protein
MIPLVGGSIRDSYNDGIKLVELRELRMARLSVR